MKIMKLKLNLVLFYSLLVVSNVISQTSLEEYNYLTKGYKIQIESGLDMKKGYKLVEVHNHFIPFSKPMRNCTISHLYREKENSPCASLIEFSRSDTKYQEFICIPSSKSASDIKTKSRSDFFVKIKDWSEPSKHYTWGLLMAIQNLSDKIINKTIWVERQVKHVFSANGGMIVYFDDGTFTNCPRCDYAPQNLKSVMSKQIDGEYSDQSINEDYKLNPSDYPLFNFKATK